MNKDEYIVTKPTENPTPTVEGEPINTYTVLSEDGVTLESEQELSDGKGEDEHE